MLSVLLGSSSTWENAAGLCREPGEDLLVKVAIEMVGWTTPICVWEGCHLILGLHSTTRERHILVSATGPDSSCSFFAFICNFEWFSALN